MITRQFVESQPSRMALIKRWGIATAILLANAAWPNGDMFFEAWEIRGDPVYVVFGNVKDTEGHYLEDASVMVRVTEPMLTYRSPTDMLGHYRSLDVGRAIVGLAYEVDPSKIKVDVEYPGYRVASRAYRGKFHQSHGIVEIDFIMARNTR